MPVPTADDVLALIDQLPDSERLELEKRLSERLDAAWNAAVDESRRTAEKKGITDETSKWRSNDDAMANEGRLRHQHLRSGGAWR